ncbi:Nascent polypeptide-associated complex subunit alpha [Wickerhamomyces ciferrii]|uniref:Nascent polypeptide-associated complex subunit alpha n=1 Tax=Wickerhamomyces ciferrii (strain ATCC 14091 / BCRC 22168 / CBS 111 / JCM 3599 / NBRC 0793 / NRRL Y-1031 F-60-10) TaxID=1206466 RepID=K0KN46_WICCF|nr:Nascent polypeptide-associated complex subunit alpha [Wickerhamomyces ciferrii]CCH44406.1 Nascent polypeptide-associated complex subunit alpha [Wickerhamomyces ciferrii]
MSAEQAPKIEEIQEEIPQGAKVSVFSKNEKKARDAIAKLNLRKVDGISRVTFKRRGNQIFAIDSPDVFKSAAGTYIVFGEAKLEDLTQRLQEAQAGANPAGHEGHDHEGHDHPAPKDPASITADLEAAAAKGPAAAEEDDDAEVDETGLKAADIELVIEQTGASRAKAAKALKKHDSDIVNAIMELSS